MAQDSPQLACPLRSFSRPTLRYASSHEPTWPVCVVVSQHGRAIETLYAWSGKRRADKHDKVRASGHLRSQSSTEQRHVPLYIDTDQPFMVMLYRHKACDRLSSGFWHTETVNGRQRMGNAADRVPRSRRDPNMQGTLTNESQHVDLNHISTEDHMHSPHVSPSLAQDWLMCGCLPQSVTKPEGNYLLRISPSLSHTKEDHVLQIRYRDNGLRQHSAKHDAKHLRSLLTSPFVPIPNELTNIISHEELPVATTSVTQCLPTPMVSPGSPSIDHLAQNARNDISVPALADFVLSNQSTSLPMVSTTGLSPRKRKFVSMLLDCGKRFDSSQDFSASKLRKRDFPLSPPKTASDGDLSGLE